MRLTIDFLQVAFPGLTGFNEENGWETEIGGQRTKLGCFSITVKRYVDFNFYLFIFETQFDFSF